MMRKLEAYMEQLAKQDLCVAFSGGVDSSLLLKIACSQAEKTGRQVYAVTFDTCLHPACDLENAARVAREIGAQHEILRVNELNPYTVITMSNASRQNNGIHLPTESDIHGPYLFGHRIEHRIQYPFIRLLAFGSFPGDSHHIIHTQMSRQPPFAYSASF